MFGNGHRGEFWIVKGGEAHPILKALIDNLGRFIGSPNEQEITPVGADVGTIIIIVGRLASQ
eukprot:9084123-Pyramimonas_sp.AAC.1